MLRVVVCDDEERILLALSSRIHIAFSQRGMVASIQTFSDVEALKKTLESSSSFDVFFLDICMPGMDGVGFGALLREHCGNVCIVFISNHEERVYDTFKVAPLRFIRKSRFNEEIDDAVQAIEAWWEQRRNRNLMITSHGEITSIPIDDVLYVEASNKVQKIITKTLTKTVRSTLGELDDKLRDHGFIKPHKGYLVNYKFIDCIETAGIHMKNEALIPISRNKITEIKQAYLKLVSDEPDVVAPRLHNL